MWNFPNPNCGREKTWFMRPEAREPIITRSVHDASRSGR
jgi:hypothetical protein